MAADRAVVVPSAEEVIAEALAEHSLYWINHPAPKGTRWYCPCGVVGTSFDSPKQHHAAMIGAALKSHGYIITRPVTEWREGEYVALEHDDE